jgi:alkanesulfonate monooxygenase SsuD/methylene tetrahydromethanopterin reductase-like flavin-dependent oxidoreductase (luciferase family)
MMCLAFLYADSRNDQSRRHSAKSSTTSKPYGGYSPNPLIFLTAVAQRTTKVRLITGAVLPAFNSPPKSAGEIGMLDGISAGRLEVGFTARSCRTSSRSSA